jgi:hypothetical protein
MLVHGVLRAFQPANIPDVVAVMVDQVGERTILALRLLAIVEERRFPAHQLDGADMQAPFPHALFDVPMIDQSPALLLVAPENFTIIVKGRKHAVVGLPEFVDGARNYFLDLVFAGPFVGAHEPRI